MKVHATSLHKDLPPDHFCICGYTTHTFWAWSVVKFGNFEVSNLDSADVIFLFVTNLGKNYTFDADVAKKIANAKKPVVCFDYTEYGGHDEVHLDQYNLMGFRIEYDGVISGDYKLLHEWLSENQSLIKCYFKRELSVRSDLTQVPFKVYPLEFVSEFYAMDGEPDTDENYYARPCLMNFVWGCSNLSRPRLSGELMKHYNEFSCEFVTTYGQIKKTLETPGCRFMILMYVPEYERIPSEEYYRIIKKSWMVIDTYGAGLKCFRNIESTKNTLSVKQDPSKLVWTYPWIDGHNCIVLPTLH